MGQTRTEPISTFNRTPSPARTRVHSRPWLSPLALIAVYGCSVTSPLGPEPELPAPSEKSSGAESTGETEHRAPAPALTSSDSFAPPLPATFQGGTISRSDLMVTLAAGIPHFLNLFEVEAQRRQGRFSGWRIVQMHHAQADRFVLRTGDLVARINHHSLERPEQLLQVWKSLGSAGEVVFDVVRGDQPSEIHFTIADDRLPVTPVATPAQATD